VLLAIGLSGAFMRTLSADYVPPTFQKLVEESTAIVDATVERLEAEKYPVLKIHEHFKGKNAPTTIKGVFLSCERTLPLSWIVPGQRYVIALRRDHLFEEATIYPVRTGAKGDVLWYQDARTRDSETLTFAEFRKRVNEARQKAVIKEQIVISGLNSPLRWLADAKIDPASPPFRASFDRPETWLKLLEGVPRPWTVEGLLKAHREAMQHAAKKPSRDYQEHVRDAAPLGVLAATRDIRAVIAVAETLSSPVEHMPAYAATILNESFGVSEEWWKDYKTHVDGARAWWEKHEDELRAELRSVSKSSGK
jgi:hypothetical protein